MARTRTCQSPPKPRAHLTRDPELGVDANIIMLARPGPADSLAPGCAIISPFRSMKSPNGVLDVSGMSRLERHHGVSRQQTDND
jgi:hypothetical protein